MTDAYTRFYLASQGQLNRSAPIVAGHSALKWGPPQEAGTVLAYTSAPFAQGATLAGPAAVTVEARTSNTNFELMADLYDVAPDGTAVQITHGGLLGSLRELDRARSWRDGNGLSMRPFLALQHDVAVPPGRLVQYAVPLQPTVWSVAPGHRLRLQLSTQPDPKVCLAKLKAVEASSLGCAPRAAIIASLIGGRYRVEWSRLAASSLSLPLLGYHVLPATRSGTTPTSNGVALPLTW
jgi:predicted acyl esterase